MTDPIEFEPHRARRYRKRSEILAFESSDAITYHKSWGTQELPAGGWVAVALSAEGQPTGEVYGIDDDAFQATYAPSLTGLPHRYMKTATIEAYQPGHAFEARTELENKKTGETKIEVAKSSASQTAMLVRNPGGEVYPIELEEFERMYVEVKDARRAQTRDDHLDPELGPKRILSLDGGGVRSILTLGVLESVERLLRERHGDETLRLCDYFDLIAGTSTGAVLAAGLAAGKNVSTMIEWFRPLAPRIFGRRWTPPLMRPRHDPSPMQSALRSLFSETPLSSETICTGLLLVTKRLDARGVWPIANNPRDPAWASEQGRPGSGDFMLREIVRASAAAPYPLQPDRVGVSGDEQADLFINGGISPHNNPAVQALLTAARGGSGLGWPVGAGKLFMVSVGAGGSPLQHQLRGVNLAPPVQSLHTMLNDAAQQIETMMQWLSESDTSQIIDAGLGNLDGELLAGEPILSYARYDVKLDRGWLKNELGLELADSSLDAMQPLDARGSAIDDLLDLGRKLGTRRVASDHFPDAFDLPPA